MIKMCESNQALRIAGVRFVQIFQELMQRLLEYRDVVHDEIRENKMSCTVNLLVSDNSHDDKLIIVVMMMMMMIIHRFSIKLFTVCEIVALKLVMYEMMIIMLC